jgi:hypothetical protein
MLGLAFTYLPLKRFYKYILKRLIGSFLRDDIDLEQLEVQLYKGIVQLRGLELDVAQFNLAALGMRFPFYFVRGSVGTIKMDIAWRHLLGQNCKIYVDGLHLVLAKGLPPNVTVPGCHESVPEGAGGSASSLGDSQAGFPRDLGAPNRYSKEGIETLSRLVKHVLSKTEACFNNNTISVAVKSPSEADSVASAPKVESILRAKVASVVVFSEQSSHGCEARSVRVIGINLSVAKPSAGFTSSSDSSTETTDDASPARGLLRQESCSNSSGWASGQDECEQILLSTDAPAGSPIVPGELHFRRSQTEEGETGSGPDTRLHFDFFFPSLRVALCPVAWRTLALCITFLEPPEEITRAHASPLPQTGPAQRVAGSDAGGVEGSPALPHRPSSSMVQSLMESSITGNPGNAGFWHELYNLFEADSQLEDATHHAGETNVAGWDEQDREEDNEINTLPAAALDDSGEGPHDEGMPGPIVGYTLKLIVAKIGVLLVLPNDPSQSIEPDDVKLLPGPASAVSTDQVQMCAEQWEVSVTQQLLHRPNEACAGVVAPCPRAVVSALVRTASVHLHQHRWQEMHQPDTLHSSASMGDPTTQACSTSRSLVQSASDEVSAACPPAITTNFMGVDIDPGMFCSAISPHQAKALLQCIRERVL